MAEESRFGLYPKLNIFLSWYRIRYQIVWDGEMMLILRKSWTFSMHLRTLFFSIDKSNNLMMTVTNNMKDIQYMYMYDNGLRFC